VGDEFDGLPQLPPCQPVTEISDSSDSECNYVGSVNIEISSDEEGGDEIAWAAGCESVSEFDEADVIEMKKGAVMDETKDERLPRSLYSELGVGLKKKGWKKVEANRSLGYNGLSERTQQHHAAKARQGQEEHRKAKNSSVTSSEHYNALTIHQEGPSGCPHARFLHPASRKSCHLCS
jgi:hypothetical protein